MITMKDVNWIDQKFPCKVVQYRKGMEDGYVTRYIDPGDPSLTWGIRACNAETPIQVPYILGSLGEKKFLKEGDWIINYRNELIVMPDKEYQLFISAY